MNTEAAAGAGGPPKKNTVTALDAGSPPNGKVKGIVDLVFLMDATGSLDICIEQVKNNLRDFIGYLTGGPANQTPVKEWRAKVSGIFNFQNVNPWWIIPSLMTRRFWKVSWLPLRLKVEVIFRNAFWRGLCTVPKWGKLRKVNL